MRPTATTAALALALIATACSITGEASPVTADPAPTTDDDGERLRRQLAILATGRASADLPPESTPEQLIDALLATPEFGHDVVPAILIGGILFAESAAPRTLSMLQAWPDSGGGAEVHFLRAPCPADQAVVVEPWWAPGTKVLVCPDAYRPERRVDARTGWWCGGANFSFGLSDFCGCGPNLVFCAPNPREADAAVRALQAEVRDTVADLVARDRPLREVYTTNATVRDATADFFYQRARLLAGEIRALPAPVAAPAASRPRPRPESWPGQHAGLLTTTHLLYTTDSVRDRIRDYYRVLWCIDGSSRNVTADAVLKLGVTNLREGDGWKELAAMQPCSGCHARLDYGMQFVSGYPSTQRATYAITAEHRAGHGPLYGRDIDDRRGAGPLTPRSFADIAVAQKEFAACMVDKFTRHVLGDRATLADVHAIRTAYQQHGTARATMRAALLRFARAWHDGPPPPPPKSTVRALIDRQCLDCHDGPDDEAGLDLGAPELSRATQGAALGQVAAGAMPLGGMDPELRRQLVDRLIEDLWSSADRDEARWYFADHRPWPAHGRLEEGAGGAGRLEKHSSPDLVRYSPGYAAAAAIRALSACRAAGKTGTELERCLDQRSAPELLAPVPMGR